MQIDGTNISMVRGDSETITVSLNQDGIVVSLEAGDTIYFTVKESVSDTEKIMQKVITDFAEGKAIIDITPLDTKQLNFTCYIYDVQLSKEDGRVITIVGPSGFNITGEVTYE